MDYDEFISSLTNPQPPSNLSSILRGLWYDKNGDWTKAHDLIDGCPEPGSAKAHAYLHRKEGDQWNADYWYRQAGTTRPDLTLDDEWDELVRYFTSLA